MSLSVQLFLLQICFFGFFISSSVNVILFSLFLHILFLPKLYLQEHQLIFLSLSYIKFRYIYPLFTTSYIISFSFRLCSNMCCFPLLLSEHYHHSLYQSILFSPYPYFKSLNPVHILSSHGAVQVLVMLLYNSIEKLHNLGSSH